MSSWRRPENGQEGIVRRREKAAEIFENQRYTTYKKNMRQFCRMAVFLRMCSLYITYTFHNTYHLHFLFILHIHFVEFLPQGWCARHARETPLNEPDGEAECEREVGRAGEAEGS